MIGGVPKRSDRPDASAASPNRRPHCPIEVLTSFKPSKQTLGDQFVHGRRRIGQEEMAAPGAGLGKSNGVAEGDKTSSEAVGCCRWKWQRKGRTFPASLPAARTQGVGSAPRGRRGRRGRGNRVGWKM